jgi:hypothetical protein
LTIVFEDDKLLRLEGDVVARPASADAPAPTGPQP